jgi:hypothetical protein
MTFNGTIGEDGELTGGFGEKEFNMKDKRYVVHGFGCSNWSEIVESKKALKKLIKKVSKDDSWSGEIVAFELKPKFYVKRSTSIKNV